MKSSYKPRDLTWYIQPDLPSVKPAGGDALRQLLYGVVVSDIKGTLTEPGNQKKIAGGIPKVFADLLSEGSSVIISSNYTKDLIEGTGLITGVQEHLHGRHQHGFFTILSEHGACYDLITFTGGKCCWDNVRTIELPHAARLRTLIGEEIIGQFPGTRIRPHSRAIISLEGFDDKENGPDNAKHYIEDTVKPRTGTIPWDQVEITASLGVLHFFPKQPEVGKLESVVEAMSALQEHGVCGPVIGFGDYGKQDMFAIKYPTINVGRPFNFRDAGIAAIDAITWIPLKPDTYAVSKGGIVVERGGGGGVVPTVRNPDDSLAYGPSGTPIKAEPFQDENGRVLEAGDASAWVLEKLLRNGFFNRVTLGREGNLRPSDEFDAQLSLAAAILGRKSVAKMEKVFGRTIPPQSEVIKKFKSSKEGN